tara:strand:+ start:302 stop:619 length:318 start_codon:yes stop_codon:yes gene_type:complete
MKKLNNIKLGLIAMSDYDLESYDLEINEIFDCILENKQYDAAPNLNRIELVDLLESLGHNLVLEAGFKDMSVIDKLRDAAKFNTNIDEHAEKILRSKIRRILLGS